MTDSKSGNIAEILVGDVIKRLQELPDKSVQTVVTSPPYWGLRDYGQEDQLGLESTPEQYVANMVEVFREVWRVLADDGTLWLNIGDTYAGTGHKKDSTDPKYRNGRNAQSTALNNKVEGFKSKDLIGVPWRVAFALQADGWYLRQDIIWNKPNAMPEPVKDRCTKSHEYIFLLSKSSRYYFDHEAIKEPATNPNSGKSWDDRKANGEPSRHGLAGAAAVGAGGFKTGETRSKRDVWTINTKPFKGAHFAVFPEALVEPCILAGSAEGDTVLDPFTGSGTVAVVALRHGRNFIGTELSPEYAAIAETRINDSNPLFNQTVIR